jgi:hypothetical protein
MASALRRRRMSYDEYLALPESVRAEWVDGEVVEAVGVHLPNKRERIPDIVVVEREPDTAYVTDTPVLLVEILSPSTRSEDTLRKSTEYLAAGVGQYWLVDRDHRAIDVLENAGGRLEGAGACGRRPADCCRDGCRAWHRRTEPERDPRRLTG